MLVPIIVAMNFRGFWFLAIVDHVTYHLVWDLTEDLLCEKAYVLTIVVVLNELNDISLCFLKLVIR
jgi:hypothetical protein